MHSEANNTKTSDSGAEKGLLQGSCLKVPELLENFQQSTLEERWDGALLVNANFVSDPLFLS